MQSTVAKKPTWDTVARMGLINKHGSLGFTMSPWGRRQVLLQRKGGRLVYGQSLRWYWDPRMKPAFVPYESAPTYFQALDLGAIFKELNDADGSIYHSKY